MYVPVNMYNWQDLHSTCQLGRCTSGCAKLMRTNHEGLRYAGDIHYLSMSNDTYAELDSIEVHPHEQRNQNGWI